jgi:hypothetical protein
MTTLADKPAWLVAWREANPEAAAAADAKGEVAQAAADARTAARAAAAPQPRSQGDSSKRPKLAPLPAPVSKWGQGFSEPAQWGFDHCKRREPVLDYDHNPPRVVRFVGWRICMKCSKPFFSDDIIALRMCAGCKTPTSTPLR